MAGEFDFIEWVKGQQKASDFIKLPAGDDLAVLTWKEGELLLVGVDQVLDGRHFDSAVHTPRQIGRKAMARNLSDCGAMGCLPAAAVVSVALPGGVGLEYAKELYLGMRDAADPFYCAIVGGDTGAWAGKLAMSVTILGRSAGIEPVTRGGANVGDGIYVTGPLGGSILGRHMRIEPRVALGRQLAKYRPMGTPCIKAMIDLSDGLSRDLSHLLAPSATHGQLGARLQGDQVPIHPDAVELSKTSGKTPLEHALHDGEDYELLFTCPVLPPVGVRVGTVVAGAGVMLSEQALMPQGWEHRI